MTALRPPSRLLAWSCLALTGWAVLLLGGCTSRGSLELLEAEIRRGEDALLQAESRRSNLESQLAEARRETELLRSQIASNTGSAPLPEQTGNLVRLSGLTINTLLSGSKNRDREPGDELLVALVAPVDEQGDLVKIAGDVEIEAYDMSLTGDDKRVGRWAFTTEEAAKAWHSGFVGAGLQFELPWQAAPNSRELVLHARLVTGDGRSFDTTSKLKIDPANVVVAPESATSRTTQPVSFQKRTIERKIPEPAQRLVPDYEDIEAEPEVMPARRLKAPPPRSNTDRPASRTPTLDGVQTSDSWTDETVPRWR